MKPVDQKKIYRSLKSKYGDRFYPYTGVCESCRKKFPLQDVVFCPDPYGEELHDNHEPMWQCKSCFRESARDI